MVGRILEARLLREAHQWALGDWLLYARVQTASGFHLPEKVSNLCSSTVAWRFSEDRNRKTIMPAVLALLVVLLVATAVWPINRLQFDADVSKVFLTDTPISKAQKRFEGRTSEDTSDVVLLIESEGIWLRIN